MLNLGGNNQQRSTGDIILQVHIANIFLTFCQRYACLCNRKVRRGLEFIVLLKVIIQMSDSGCDAKIRVSGLWWL